MGYTSDDNGGYSTVYRLLPSGDDQFVGWLLSNTYWSKNCQKDADNFKKKCDEKKGEFVDYNNGCEVNNLQLSCVYPTKYENEKDALSELAKEFYSYVSENWSQHETIETESGSFESSPLN